MEEITDVIPHFSCLKFAHVTLVNDQQRSLSYHRGRNKQISQDISFLARYEYISMHLIIRTCREMFAALEERLYQVMMCRSA